MCGLLTFGAGTASAAEPPDIVQLVAAMQQEGQNAAEKAAFTGGGYRASLLRAAETAAQAAAAAPVSAPAQEDPGETGGDEEPSEPAQVTQHSIHDENGYYVHNGSAYNSITKDGLWVGGTDENTGFHVDSNGNVTTTGSITVNHTGGAGSVTIDASTGKITGVMAGDINENSTDAVNGSQLYNAIQGAEGTTYAAGDGVVIADGSTTGEDKTISVKAGNGIEAGADGVAVKVNGNNLTVNENGLSLSETLSGLTSVTASGAITAGSFAAGNVKINENSGGTITGLTNTKWNGTATSGQAATEDQLAIVSGKVTAAKTEVVGDSNVKVDSSEEADGHTKYTVGLADTVTLGESTGSHVTIDGTAGTITATGAVTAGSFVTTGDHAVTVGNGTITGLTNTTWNGTATSGQAATEDQLKAVADADKYVTGGSINSTDGTLTLNQAKTGTVTISGLSDYVASVNNYVTGGSIDTSSGDITLNRQLGGSVTISGLKDYVSGIDTYVTSAKIDGTKLTINKNHGDAVEVDLSGLADGLSTSDYHLVANPTGGNYKVKDGKVELTVQNGDDTADKQTVTIEGIASTDDVTNIKTNVEELGKLAVKYTDESKTAVNLGSATLTTTGAITGGSFEVNGKTYISDAGLNANNQKITGVLKGEADTDAVNVGQLNDALKNVKGTAYEAGNKGITVDNENDTISAKADEKNVTVGENGIALKDDISVVSVTTSGDVTIGGALNVTGATTLTGALMANGAATFTQGASMDGQKITNVKAGEANTDAVNKSQLDAVQSQIKNYAAGDGINIGDGNTISVKYENGLSVDNGRLTVKADPNGNVEVTSAGIDLKDSITLTGKVTAAQGLYVDNDTYFSNDGLYLSSYAKWTMTDGLVLSPYTSLTDTSLKIGGSTYISDAGLNANNKVISNVLDGKDTNDAVNYGQLSALQEDFTELNDLAVTYDAATKATITLDGTGGTKITNVAAGDISQATSTDAVNGGQLYTTNQIIGDGGWNARSNYLTGNVGNLTDAANALDSAIGNNRYTGDNVLNANTDGKTYASVTAAIGTLDSNIGNLKFSGKNVLAEGKAASITAALTTLDEKIGPMSWESTTFLRNQGNLSGAAQLLDNNLSQTLQLIGVNTTKDAEGNVIPNPNIDWTGFHYATGEAGSSSTTIIGVMRSLDSQLFNLTGRVDALDSGGTQSLSAFSKMSAANVSALSALSNMDTKTAETLASMSSEQVETLAAKAPAAAPAAPAPGDPATSTRPGPDGGSETGDTGKAYEVNQDLHVTGETTLDGALTVNGAGTFNDGLTVNTKTEGGTALTVYGGASINGTLNMNGNKITGVADGEISETSTDAVNGSQLWGVQQDIENNASAIASLGGQVSRLDNRIDRVGAGAAALAALHPLDFDPDAKWDFAAGYGNYRGANATAIGAFYRPNEDVMFSVGGSFGGGENMVNAGVSFKLGSGSGLTTSRTAMARELAAMKDTVAAQNAQIEAQAKQIEELTALVEKLAAEKAGAPEEKEA